MDFELDTFRQLLTDEQKLTYEEYWRENIVEHEKQQAKADLKALKQVAFHQEVLDYYQENIIPTIKQSRLFSMVSNNPTIENKGQYLKAEYKRIWQEQKKSIYIQHYRRHRLFQPNALKAALLQHQRGYVFPLFSSIEASLDAPTKAIARLIHEKTRYYKEDYDEFFHDRQEKWLGDLIKIVARIFGENPGSTGFSVTEKADPEPDREAALMTLVLMDKEQ